MVVSIKMAKHISYLEGKKGRIYIARKATVMVFVVDNGEVWFINCSSPSNTIALCVDDNFWKHSIDWEGRRIDYMAHQFALDSDPKSFYIS